MSALLTSGESREKANKKCVFCYSVNHPPLRCLKISNSQYKRTILKRNDLCFLYFYKGNKAPSCTLSNYSCNKYKGKHNIKICIASRNPKDRNNTRSFGQSNTASMDENSTNPTDGVTNNFTSNSSNNKIKILPQTAKTSASDLIDLSFANIGIMFNSGSQRALLINI